MALRPGVFCGLLLLFGCAAPAEPPGLQAQPLMQTQATALRGTILAMRPVPVEPPGPARVLLAGLGGPGASVHGSDWEFIVRIAGGTTISVVQARTAGLRPGEEVSILSGPETRIGALAGN
jgi:hypothetical protein